jgi:CRISPR/Cas system Type II protein with McrA/HNH and RuvC-like nuclease domain
MALKPYRSTPHWKKLRLQVLRRDAYTCTYCGDVADQVDHVYPKSKGGEDTLDNCVAACAKCNSAKRDKLDTVFLAQASTPPDLGSVLSPIRTNQTKTDKNGRTFVKIELDSPFSASNESGATENG